MRNPYIFTAIVLFANACSNQDSPLNSNKIRNKSIQDTAISYAAQSALAWQSNRINTQLMERKNLLDRIYNFNSLILPHNVLPPVLREAKSSLNLSDSKTIRAADRTIEIVHEARFVTSPPTWREYLIMSFEPPEAPADAMLPQSIEEREIWDKNIAIGWAKGYKQANAILREDLGKLAQDYAGMAFFKKLYLQNMVTAPHVATANLGITGDNKKLSINDRITRITSDAELMTYRSNSWKSGISIVKSPRKKKTNDLK